MSLGQYMRSIGRNGPFGAGSQLASLSAPGDSFWKWSVIDPSALVLRLLRGLTVNLFSDTLTFAKGQEPPINGFWSITMQKS